MRLNRQQIKSLSTEILAKIAKSGVARLEVPEEDALALLEKAMADDLSVEDRLNEEVKDILQAYESEIAQGRMDYKTMFDLVKKKLVKERGLVI